VTVFIGITGGIATGKSTVSHMLKELGYPVVDADLLVREVQRPGEEVYRKIVEKFGGEILLENGDQPEKTGRHRLYKSRKAAIAQRHRPPRRPQADAGRKGKGVKREGKGLVPGYPPSF